MSKFYMSSEDLIQSIRRKGQLPKSAETLSDEDFLAMADEELSSNVIPNIIKQHENYMLYTESIPIVEDKTRYPIPYRAMGNRLVDLTFQDDNDNIFPLRRIEFSDLHLYNGGQFYAASVYYILNNLIVIYPETVETATGNLNFTYYLRSNKLVKTEKIAVINTIDRTSGIITVDSVPSEFASSLQYDLYSTKDPYPTLTFDIDPVSIDSTNNQIVFDVDDIPTLLEEGDHIAIAGQCAIPQIPCDMHNQLAQAVYMNCLESLGDFEGLKAAKMKMTQIEINQGTILDNRVENAPKKLFSRNGFLRQSFIRNRHTRRW